MNRGQRLLRLLDGLLEATRAGAVTWTPGKTEGTYELKTSGGLVKVAGLKPPSSPIGSTLMHPLGGATINVTDANGTVTDSHKVGTDSQLLSHVFSLDSSNDVTFDQDQQIGDALVELMSLVRVDEIRASAAVDDILNALREGQ